MSPYMQAVVVADGVRYDVDADLHREPNPPVSSNSFGGKEEQPGHPPGWGGTLKAEDANAAWKIYNSTVRILVLANDAKGTFTVPQYEGESTELVIAGSGTPPF